MPHENDFLYSAGNAMHFNGLMEIARVDVTGTV
jgi:hypothetical protein